MLLQKGGRCVYFGDIGVHSRTIIDYFESNGAAKCPDKANPAECKSRYITILLEVITAADVVRIDILQVAESRYVAS